MAEKKSTTKEILEVKLGRKEHVPLYNPEALDKLRNEFTKWSNTILREQDCGDWHITPHCPPS